MNSATTGPVQPQERIQLIDVLRGFALLGILQVNWENTSDWLYRLIEFFAEGSFYTMYSFLFGLGFSLQMIRAEQLGRPFVFRYLWRTALLLIIGTLHYVLIWTGDILRVYALIAPVLLLLRRARPAVVLGLAGFVLVCAMAPGVLPPPGQTLRRVDPEQVEPNRSAGIRALAANQNPTPAWCQMIPGLTDTYRRQVCNRGENVRRQVIRQYTDLRAWLGYDSSIMFMFLLGLYVGRRRLLSEAAQHTRLLLWVGAVSLVIGLAGNGHDTYSDFFDAHGLTLPNTVTRWVSPYYLGNFGLALFYMSALALCFTRWNWAQRVLAPLGKVGRMGLTNYLMQSIVFSLILGGAGFGVMSRFKEGWGLLLINSFFVVQIVYSHWWFKYFQFGPAEWAWRSLTWWRLQPMRRTLVASPGDAS